MIEKINYMSPISDRMTEEEIEQKLIRFIQQYKGRDKIRLEDVLLVSVCLMDANPSQTKTPVIQLGYPCFSKITIRSPEMLSMIRKDINHPLVDKIMRVIIKMFPQFKGYGTQGSLSEKTWKYLTERGYKDFTGI